VAVMHIYEMKTLLLA